MNKEITVDVYINEKALEGLRVGADVISRSFSTVKTDHLTEKVQLIIKRAEKKASLTASEIREAVKRNTVHGELLVYDFLEDIFEGEIYE